MRLEVKNVSCGYASKTVFSGVSLEMMSGEALCLLGPNGVGKTTFFKTILGFLKILNGEILLNGEDISKWSRKYFASKVGYIPQTHIPPFPFKVLDVVVMGRTAHLSAFALPNQRDWKIAEESLHILGISHLKDQSYTEISGGERQLVLIARALTQEPELLIMDEPTSNLDFGNQIKVLKLIKEVVDKGKLGVIMTTHIPNHAFLIGSKVAVMGGCDSFVFGAPDEVITEKRLKDVYGVDVKIVGEGKKKVCIPT
ncbi:MAG: Iron-chelate-transporting ATPase [Firmicutes bacterium]|nr:Iron-chelate-transporting ATPase [Bacillota bacterium]